MEPFIPINRGEEGERVFKLCARLMIALNDPFYVDSKVIKAFPHYGVFDGEASNTFPLLRDYKKKREIKDALPETVFDFRGRPESVAKNPYDEQTHIKLVGETGQLIIARNNITPVVQSEALSCWAACTAMLTGADNDRPIIDLTTQKARHLISPRGGLWNYDDPQRFINRLLLRFEVQNEQDLIQAFDDETQRREFEDYRNMIPIMPNPQDVDREYTLYASLHGLEFDKVRSRYMDWLPSDLERLLEKGPMMFNMRFPRRLVNGNTHWIVISDIVRSIQGGGTYLRLIDPLGTPLRPERGHIHWVKYEVWLEDIPFQAFTFSRRIRPHYSPSLFQGVCVPR